MKRITKLLLILNCFLITVSVSEEPKFDRWDLGDVSLVAKPEKAELISDEKCIISVFIINNTDLKQQFKIAGVQQNDKVRLGYELSGKGYSNTLNEVASYSINTSFQHSKVTINLEPRSSKIITTEVVVTPFKKDSYNVYATFKILLQIDGVERETNGFSLFYKKDAK